MGKIIFIFAISIFLTACGPTAEAPSTESPPTDHSAIDPTEEYLSWKLISTDSLEYFPEISEYSGDENVRGWMVERQIFGTEKFENRFYVIEEDIEKLPPPYQGISEYRIDENVMDLLKRHNDQNPAKVRVIGIKSAWETAPFIKIAEVL